METISTIGKVVSFLGSPYFFAAVFFALLLFLIVAMFAPQTESQPQQKFLVKPMAPLVVMLVVSGFSMFIMHEANTPLKEDTTKEISLPMHKKLMEIKSEISNKNNTAQQEVLKQIKEAMEDDGIVTHDEYYKIYSAYEKFQDIIQKEQKENIKAALASPKENE